MGGDHERGSVMEVIIIGLFIGFASGGFIAALSIEQSRGRISEVEVLFYVILGTVLGVSAGFWAYLT